MNKLLIVLLIIGLITVHVHGFVKRDAPKEEQKNPLDEITKALGSMTDAVKKAWEENAPEFQKKVTEGLQSISKQVEDLTKKNEEAKH